MKSYTFIISFILLIVAGTASAQEFEIGAEYKPRAEMRRGVWRMRPADNRFDKTSNIISQRARLNFSYYNKESKIRLGAQLQDVRTWGSTTSMNLNNPGGFDIHQFWGEILFSDKFSAKLGRQEISYDNQRIFGAVDWAQQARSFDAIVLKLENKSLKAHVGLSYNMDADVAFRSPYSLNNYKSLQYLWINNKFDRSFSLSFLFLNDGREYTVEGGDNTVVSDRKIAYSQTAGIVLNYLPEPFGFSIEGYYQGGKNKNNKSLNAYDLRADLTYKLGDGWSLNGGSEVLSGTSMINESGKDRSFNPLYGTNHKFNGYMDYFYVGGRHQTSNMAVGLSDIFLGVKYSKEKIYGELNFHKFGAMANVYRDINNSGSNMKKNLGLESDFIIGYRMSSELDLQGGFSFYKATESLEILQAGTDAGKLNTWGFMQVTFKPTFFKYKK